ncbi:M48 family metalloprotease [Escherichia coli]
MCLVSHANSVKTPFHFFLINNDEINAFAFFGGNVVLHSALFRYSDNESQLASVMAHEISTSPNVTWRERWKIDNAVRR